MNFFYINSEELYNKLILYSSNNINVSFEFFPPNTVEMERIFWISIDQLSKFSPIFISITHGMHDRSYDSLFSIVKKVQDRTRLIVAPHLVCGNATLKELQLVAEKYWNSDIRHVIALRGDKLNKLSQFSMYAVDLVRLLKQIGDFDVSVAAYPEVHPEAVSAESDLLNLKKKVDAGANRAITQFFFSVEKYLKFRDLCVSYGIKIPIIPGILPICNFNQLQHFLSFTRVKLPQWIVHIFNNLDSHLEIQKMIGVIIAMDMIKVLIYEGVKDFHFYTLNRFEFVYTICSMLGLKERKDKKK